MLLARMAQCGFEMSVSLLNEVIRLARVSKSKNQNCITTALHPASAIIPLI